MDLLDIVIAKQLAGGGGGSGTDNYNDLSNLPKINDVTLSGNKTSANLGLQSEINSDNKLASDLVDDTNQDNKFVTSAEKNTWNAKQNAIDADHKLNADYVDDSTSTNKFVTASDKEAWNAKQNAIDSEHKLSSSLVSFTTAEAAALASGIDSTKVEQIGTNQTNILYSLQTGVKNLFNPEASGNWQYGLSSYSADAKTGTISMATTASDWARTSVPITLPAGEYKFCGNVTALVGSAVITGNTSSSGQETAIFNNIELSTTGTFEISFTLNTETPFWIAVYANFSSSIVSNSVTITGMMICTKAAWEQEPNVYRPFARPNYDLTVRESEDRVALVEVVNKGAKNKFNFDAWKSVGVYRGSKTVSGNRVTITSSQNDAFTYVDIANGYPQDALIYVSTGDILIFTWDYTNSNSQATDEVMICGNGAYTSYVHVLASAKYLEYTVPSGITYITIRLGVATSGDSATYSNLMICTKSEYDISPAYEPHALPNTDLTRMVNDLQKKAVKVYTYHVNPNESDPEDAVTYLDDATGLTPAKMGASSFSYGSWANAWFLPRPCMLKSDGAVACYLNPNDYSKKTDGTASDIADANFDGNVMLEFPKIWVKRVAGSASGERTVSIAPVNVDGTYKCWSNINAEDKEVDHFYLPAYNGTIHSSKMRSLSGVTLDTTYAPIYTRAQEVTAATANNPSGKNMWYTETWADMCLVYDLLYLMGKSLDVQRTFGQGLSSGAETAMRAYVTGTHNAKGLFYGDVSGTSTAVKVLGMENLWGCRWRGVAGLINDNGTLKVKMTYGVADGSTAVGYNTTGDGYLNYGSTYGTAGFVKKMQADNTMGYKIIETAGTDATYYCDYYYVNNSQSNYALLGGRSGSDAHCGFCVNLRSEAANTTWNIGGSLSCRP